MVNIIDLMVFTSILEAMKSLLKPLLGNFPLLFHVHQSLFLLWRKILRNVILLLLCLRLWLLRMRLHGHALCSYSTLGTHLGRPKGARRKREARQYLRNGEAEASRFWVEEAMLLCY